MARLPLFSFFRLLSIRVIILLINVYQRTLSPLIPMKCRFEPSCSHYMADALREWGLLKGGWLGLKRIGRCHPFGDWGYDPAPRKMHRGKDNGDHR